MKNIEGPDYKRIYEDIIRRKYPDKENKCNEILKKQKLTSIDIIKLNQLIFETIDRETDEFNQKHRCYDEQTIIKILEYQQKYRCNNIELSNHFKVSRNTITRWKKYFIITPKKK